MPDSGAWYGTVGGKDSGGMGREFSYTHGHSNRTVDAAARAKRHAKVKAKRKAARRARKGNRG